MKITRRQRRRLVGVLAGLAVTASMLTACGSSGSNSSATSGAASSQQEGKNTPLKIILQPAANGLPVLVAQSQGFFGKHGITVSKIDHQETGALYPALVAKGQYDIADMPPPQFITAAAQSLGVVAVANEFNVSKSFPLEYLMVRSDSPIKTIKDLAGKTVGTVSVNGNLWISFQNAVKKAGIDLSSIRPVQMSFPNMTDQLAAHRVDAVLAIAPFSDALKTKGNKVIGEPYLSIGSEVIGQLFAANRGWAQTHKGEIKSFIAALKDATAYMKDHPDVSAQQLAKFTGVTLETAKNTQLPPFSYALDPKGIALWQQTMEFVNAGGPGVAKLDPKNLVLNLGS